jgi:DNA-binding MarR family transcriptional regulator
VSEADISETARELRLVIGQLVRRARAETDLPAAQAAVLGHLEREGPMSTSELAGRQRVRHQSMSRTVGQLIALGLVASRPHPRDGRKILLVLTDAGRTELENQRNRRADWLAEAIAGELTPAERQTLTESVRLLARLAAR